MIVYLDCNATTPIEPQVLEVLLRYTKLHYANAGSRTHELGARAKQAVENARSAVASVVHARPEEVVFTSGATEANNLAILGLLLEGINSGRKHIVSTTIEHKSVLEPLESARRLHGFEVTLVPVSNSGFVKVADVLAAVRPDTILLSVMHVNNETGVIQPISQIADSLSDRDVYFHVDAAQGFGKELGELRNQRIDLISASAHKIYGPKGVGALIARSARRVARSITPLMYGGGQERGLRPGTVPVPLAAAFGEASRLAVQDFEQRAVKWRHLRQGALEALMSVGALFNGHQDSTVPTTINLSIPGLDSEAAMLVLRDLVAISNGSACTSTSYEPSHVLMAMKLPKERIDSALRFSWSHLTPEPPWTLICDRLRSAH